METTLNIRHSIMIMIDAAAKLQGVSSSAMIMRILKEYIHTCKAQVRLGRLVQYQERDADEEYHEFHFYLRADEYEYLSDSRKLFKLSVSLMVALAAKKFLFDKKNFNNTDNCPFYNYIIIKEEIDHLICWRSIWGYTDVIAKYIT